jgi:hypothetical protein
MSTYLKFTDEAEAQSVLCDYYSSEFGWNCASLIHSLDPVGTLYNNDAVFDLEGNVITEPTKLTGWHVNFIGDLPNTVLLYALQPANPKRVFAE